MAIIRFDRPIFRSSMSEFDRMRSEMNAILRAFGANEDFPPLPGDGVYPPLNISDDADNVYVRAEVPGITGSDLQLSVEGETLVIKGERKASAADEKLSFHRREIECGSFSRAITLTKAEEAKPRQIAVKAG
jgi:HSP20 family protein